MPAGFESAEAAREAFTAFVADELYPALSQPPEGLAEEGIRVHFRGAEVERHAVRGALRADCLKVLVGAAAVLLVTLSLTRSLPLSLYALLVTFEPVLVGHVIFKNFSGVEDVSAAVAVALFAVPLLAFDVTLALSLSWRRAAADLAVRAADLASGGEPEGEPDNERLTLASLWLAGSAASSAGGVLCALCCCAACVFSSPVLPREVGVFLGGGLVGVLLLAVGTYPLVLIATPPGLPCLGCCLRPGAKAGPIVPVSLEQAARAAGRRPGRWEAALAVLRLRAARVATNAREAWLERAHRHSGRILVALCVLAGLVVIALAARLEFDDGTDLALPGDHPLVRGRQLLKRFDTYIHMYT